MALPDQKSSVALTGLWAVISGVLTLACTPARALRACAHRVCADARNEILLPGGVDSLTRVILWPPTYAPIPGYVPFARSARAVQRGRSRADAVAQHRVDGGPLTYLEAHAVTPPIRRDYRERVVRMLHYVQMVGLPFNTGPEIDAALATYFDEEFAAGDHHSAGLKTFMGFVHYFPFHSARGALSLPRAKRALDSWQRKEPASSKAPVVWEGACAVAALLAAEGEVGMAVYVLVGYDTYARPRELHRVKVSDVIPAIPGTPHNTPAIKLNPLEGQIPSKVGVFDENVPLSGDGKRAVVALLVTLWAQICREVGQEKLFPFSFDELAKKFTLAARRCGLGRRTLYDLRHGGASDDGAEGRTEGHIQSRGRWSQATSMRRYRKPGILQEGWATMSVLAVSFAHYCARDVVHLILQPSTLPPLPCW